MQEEYVVLVDEKDQELGLMEKLKAHELGKLHRAFSVFVFNKKGELLLHQRASSKYHSPNLWTNTCCSHPRHGETILEAANRRLFEEMGMKVKLRVVGHLIYKANLGKNLFEHEYDYILLGQSDDNPKINLEEVKDYKYMTVSDIDSEVQKNPKDFTEWFKLIIPTLPRQL